MRILYVSTLISEKKMNSIIENSNNKPLQSIQKFHRLICEGIAKNGISVKTLSSIPMSQKISKKVFWFDKKEIVNRVEYTYIPFINLKIIRQIFTSIGIIFKIIKECFKNKKEKIFICDILNTTISTSTLILSKIFKFKCIAIVTDLPENIGKGLNKKINELMQSKYDGYIILTQAMNEVINKNKKPYIVIEGIANIEMENSENKIENKYKNKVCLYAGGLYAKYGVKSLIDAFLELENKDTELHLYGAGELEEEIKKINDRRIKYFGVVSNEKVVQEELKATLLVNPRYTNQEYTKYSFPSKNMEYMASGTPILTTKLPGMPEEYYKYIFLIEDESKNGMKKSLAKILNLPREVLYEKGREAKEFVLKYKNNNIKTKKIINLCTEIMEENKNV